MKNRRNDMLRSVEDYSRFRAALEQAVKPELPQENDERNLDSLPDESQVGLTDSMMMHAGIGVSRLGITIGIEAPSTLEQVHRRGETFLYATLGATALYAVYDATKQLL